MELGKSHTIRIFNDKRVAVGYIYTGFDKRCADKHIYLALDKPSPYIEKFFLAHSSVCNSDIRFGYHRMNICGAGIYAFNTVVDIVNIMRARRSGQLKREALECSAYRILKMMLRLRNDIERENISGDAQRPQACEQE